MRTTFVGSAYAIISYKMKALEQAQKTTGGFTVIEVILFLAVSGMLFLITLVGTGATIRSIRFSDSARSLHTYMQSQYDSVLSGVNTRTNGNVCQSAVSTNPGASDCLIIGKMIRLETGKSQVLVYPIITSISSSNPTSGGVPDLSNPSISVLSDEALISDLRPVVIKQPGRVETFDIPWGATISASQRNNPPSASKPAANTYVIIRSPRSSRIVSYTFNMTTTEFNALSANVPVDNFTSYLAPATGSIQKKTNYCIKGAEVPVGKAAAITVGAGQGLSDIQVAFEVNEATECNNV